MPEDTQTQTPQTADPSVENAALRGALEKLRAEFATLKSDTEIVAKGAAEAKSALGAALIERDTFAAQVKKLEPVAAEAENLRTQVQTFVNTGRENELLSALQPKLPGAEPAVIRSVLATLTEQGRANRYAEDSAAEATKVLEIITKETPSLARPVTTTGGSSVLTDKRAHVRPVVRNLVTGR